MFGRQRIPVLRLDRLTSTERERARAALENGSQVVPPDDIRYTFSTDPETYFQLSSWKDLAPVLQSIGSGLDRGVVRFSRLRDDREVAAEALGSGRLDKLFLRWSDSGLRTKAVPPWLFATSERAGTSIRVPLGDVPASFDDLTPSEYERFPGLDITAVPTEAVLTVEDATVALQWFLETWPDESSPILDWRRT